MLSCTVRPVLFDLSSRKPTCLCCPVLSVMFRLSCHGRLPRVALSMLSCCHVLSRSCSLLLSQLSSLTVQSRLSCSGCPRVPAIHTVSAVLPQHPCPQLSCHACPVFTVMPWLACTLCPARTDLSMLICQADPSRRPVLAVLSQMSNPYSSVMVPVLGVLSWLYCLCWHDLAVLSSLSCPGSTVQYRPFFSVCTVSAGLSQLPSPRYPVPAVLLGHSCPSSLVPAVLSLIACPDHPPISLLSRLTCLG